MNEDFLTKIRSILNTYESIVDKLNSGTLSVKDMTEFSKKKSEIDDVVVKIKFYEKNLKDIEESELILKSSDSDQELRQMANDQMVDLKNKNKELLDEIKILMLPKDKDDHKDVIVEIRAGTGGDEAGLFANEIFNSYLIFIDNKRFKYEIISKNLANQTILKEVIFSVSGKDVFSIFKYESGTHRVQRIPKTENNGRVHTSAITVAVLPEADDIEIDLKPSEIRVDIYRSSGPGGQSVNTTDSAVRMTHLPTGIVVCQQDEKSQIKNREKAMKILKTRVYDFLKQQQDNKISSERRDQIGSGDRSEKIRTYNFPQNRITDHRINLSIYKLDTLMKEGLFDELINPLKIHEQSLKLQSYEGGK